MIIASLGGRPVSTRKMRKCGMQVPADWRHYTGAPKEGGMRWAGSRGVELPPASQDTYTEGRRLEFRIKETSRREAFLAYPATVDIH